MKPNSVISHTTKKAYPTKDAANKVVAYLLTKDVVVRSYKCFCEQFHLTSQKGK